MGKHRPSKYTKQLVIPDPPRKDEYYSYLAKQPYRLFSVILFTLSLGGTYGIWAVFSQSPIFYPFLILLVVLIPWSIYIVVLSLFRPRVTYESHERVKEAGKPWLHHSVDVFIPVCGERLEILKNTFYHASRMQWPGELTVYCLDDGDSEEVKSIAEYFGLKYLVREDRPLHKKSGNMNNGLAYSTGEFIAVFDADFAPAVDFLLETVPYMLYSNIGIVQTAQYFDVKRTQTRNWIQQLSGTIQDMFFCWAQPSRTAADAGMCVGTNVVYRRKALELAGGFPRVDSGGEDVLTGLEFMKQGYRTLYVPINVAKGVCPDTFEASVNQQYRWAGSSMRMFFRPKSEYSRIFWSTPMRLRQRLVFMSGILYYIQSIMVLVIAVVPSVVMVWFFPGRVYIGNYIPIAPAMLGMFALPLIIRGWRPSMLRLILIYSVSHMLSLMDILKGTSAGWVATGASKKSDIIPAKAGWIMRTWIVVFQSLMWWGIIFRLPVYGWSNYWPAIVMSAFQTIIFLPLLLPNYGIVAQPTLMPYLIKRNRFHKEWRKQEVAQRRSNTSKSASRVLS
jgi:cellulose synthase (UDP-forming)